MEEHILDMTYYKRLQEFLVEIIQFDKPTIDGSTVLYIDCPPVKDEVWGSLPYYSASPE